MIFGNWLLWFTLFVNFLHFYYVVNFDFLPSGINPINSGFSVRIISSILVFCIEHLHFKTKTIVFLNDLSFTFVVYLSEPKSGVHFRLFDVIAELWRLVVTLWFREFLFQILNWPSFSSVSCSILWDVGVDLSRPGWYNPMCKLLSNSCH